MTQILIDIRRPESSGQNVNTSGEIEWYPSRRHNASSSVILPTGFVAPLTGDSITIEAAPSNSDFCWGVIERTIDVQGKTQTYRRFVSVPDSSSQVNYIDLTNVDPTTFEPATYPPSPLNPMVVSGSIVGDNLILSTYGGGTVDAGNVRGPRGYSGIVKSTTAPSDTTVLWLDTSVSAVLPSLDDIGDVAVASPTSGQVLKWNGTSWVNSGIEQSQINGLADAFSAKLSIQAEKDFEGTPANTIDTSPRWALQNQPFISGTQYFTFFTPRTTMTVTNISVVTTTAPAGVSAAYPPQLGLYSFDGTTATLLQSVTEQSMFNTPQAVTKTIPSTTLVAGQRYAVSVLMTATTMPNFVAMASNSTAAGYLPPRLTAGITGRTSMGAVGSTVSLPNGYTNNSSISPWARLS
jgi:hypothetical protein